MALGTRTMALPLGRGALTLGAPLFCREGEQRVSLHATSPSTVAELTIDCTQCSCLWPQQKASEVVSGTCAQAPCGRCRRSRCRYRRCACRGACPSSKTHLSTSTSPRRKEHHHAPQRMEEWP